MELPPPTLRDVIESIDESILRLLDSCGLPESVRHDLDDARLSLQDALDDLGAKFDIVPTFDTWRRVE